MASRNTNDLFEILRNEHFAPEMRWQPRVDIYYNDEAIFVQVEAPGLDESQLSLRYEASARHLVIEGVRLRPACPSACRCLQMEIEYGPFRRAVALPQEVDASGIEARLEAGFLLISVPRRAPQSHSSTRIAVK